LIRGICQQDPYQAWKAFVLKVLEAVPEIQKTGMHAMLRHPTRWKAFLLHMVVDDVWCDLRNILRDIGYGDAAGMKPACASD